MKESIKIESIRHLNDLDDISSGKRDGDIESGQELIVEKYAKFLNNELKVENKKALFFIVSSKIRCSQTADSIIESIKKINNKIKISKITESRIDSLDEGTVNVPEGYKKGDFFIGFPKAANAFNKESHATDHGLDKDNYLYKYGDPHILENGDYKYPELLEYFKTYGESYRDLLLRIFELIEETAKKVDKFDKGIKVIVVTHAQVNHIFKDLISLAEKIKKGLVNINEGELPFLAWREFLERYNNSKKDLDKENVFFRFASSMDIDYLLDPNILNILKREVKYLKNLK